MNQEKLNEIREWVKKNVSPARLRHIRGVVQASAQLAARHRVDARKTELAAWLHDCAKELSRAGMKSLIRRGPFRLDPGEKSLEPLWHPHASAAMARKKWGVRDKEILEAVRCHTLGKPGMGLLAQMLFVADFIEPGRRFKGAAEVRKKAMRDLGAGVAAKASMTVGFLLKKNKRIHPRLLETWNDFAVRKTMSTTKPIRLTLFAQGDRQKNRIGKI